MTLKARGQMTDFIATRDGDARGQVAAPEPVDRGRHVAKRRHDAHAEQPAQERNRRDDQRVVRRERPHVEWRRRQDDQPIAPILGGLDNDDAVVLSRGPEHWPRLVE